MAVVKNLVVRAVADFSSITTQSQKASKAMSNMSSSIAGSASKLKSILSAVGVGLSVGAVISFAKQSAEAYKDQAEAEIKLASVMKNTTAATKEQWQSIKDLCSEQQRLGVIGDEVALAGAQELATYITQTDTLKTLIPVMEDMAAQQYGYSASAENVTSIATMMGKVLNGQTSSLSKLGYKFTKAQEAMIKYGTEAQAAATLAEVVSESVGGVNEALGSTPLGRIQQVKNEWGDLKETIGEIVTKLGAVLTPIASAAISMLQQVANAVLFIVNSCLMLYNVLAKIFGGKGIMMSNYGTAASGIGEVSDSLDSAADSASGASSAAKEAQKQLMGFDEINRLAQVNNSSSGTGAGSGTAAGLTETDSGSGWWESTVEWWHSLTGLQKALAVTSAAVVAFKAVCFGLNALKDVGSWITAFSKKIKNLGGSASTVSTDIKTLGESISGFGLGSFSQIANVSLFGTVLAGVGLAAAGFFGIIKYYSDLSWSEIFENFSKGLSQGLETAKKNLRDAADYMSKKWEDIKQDASDKWEDIKTAWSDTRDWCGELASNFTEGWTTGDWSSFLSQITDGMRSVYNTVSGWIETIASYWNSFVEKLNLAGNLGEYDVDYSQSIYLQGFATGGFPNAGQLFIADEAGPELVGSIGNRSAVANNDQIIEGIRQGVYDAVSSAMRSNNQQIRVFLDSKEIRAGQQRLNRAMGV